jgi:hypothetical protein
MGAELMGAELTGAGVTGATDDAPRPARGSGARRRPPYVLRAAPVRSRGSMYLRIGSSCGADAGTLDGDRSQRRKIGSSSGCGAGPGGGRRGTTPLPLVAPLTGAVDAVDAVDAVVSAAGGACAGTAGCGLAGAAKPVGAANIDVGGGGAAPTGSL